MKFFYILQRNGMITEKIYNPAVYLEAMNIWRAGGILAVTKPGSDIPSSINAADISNICTEDEYENYLLTNNPKFYIKNGVWYDRKDPSKPFRYEPWRLREIENEQKKLAKPEDPPLTPEQRAKINAIEQEIRQKLGIKSKN